MKPPNDWKRYQDMLCRCPSIGLRLDLSRMMQAGVWSDDMTNAMQRALAAMEQLERGAKANVTEGRMVGHYWLRSPELAPSESIGEDIRRTVYEVKRFADGIHSATIKPQQGDASYVVLIIGVGGSVLGPQLLCDAFGGSEDPVIIRFIDNTDPDGIDRVLAELDDMLSQTLTIVISKSGTTIETNNAMRDVAGRYAHAGLDFANHAVAVTCSGSPLHQMAIADGWLAAFPMWDWVGGRTSITSAVGLLPAALLGVDVDAFLAGARDCDAVTREADLEANPAALLSAAWHEAGEGRGRRDLVVLPYRDRLAGFGRYLQQLVMESVGKKESRAGDVVHQGLTVYGYKGSTDQHALVQQLIDGPDDFFGTFITILQDRPAGTASGADGAETGDCLNAFWLGTRDALTAAGRRSMTVTLDRLDAHRLGALIALFERAVGLYAELIDVNAYDQPAVEAGKASARAVIDLQQQVLHHLRQARGDAQTVEEIANAIGEPHSAETVYHILEHLSASRDRGIRRVGDDDGAEARYERP